ncbi:hypothetical protein ACI2OX_05065 [Bacillus sp. N9]
MVDIQKVNKIEYNKALNHKLKLYFNKAELVFNCETKTWDIDLRGARDCEFESQDKVNLTIYLENGGIFRGDAVVITSIISNENFHL